MKKAGFTLIELLAVIVILAIIALIAVPIVINIINDAKEESLKRSVQQYLDSVTSTITKENLTHKYNPEECIIQEDGNVICSENGNELSTSNGTNKLEIVMKGNKPTGGSITLQNGKIIDIEDINIKGKYASFDENKKIVFYSIEMPTEPGLYDVNRKLIADWEETMDILFLNIDEEGTLYRPDENWDAWDSMWVCNETAEGEFCYLDIEKLNKARLLVISNTVTNIGEETFSGCNSLKKIVIPDSFTSIGDYAFYGCTGLTSITIPNSVTSIGQYAFFGCTGLTSITIPNSVTSIEESTFERCKSLTSITIPSSVTSIGNYAFAGCTGLTSATFENTTGWYLTNWNNSEHIDIDVTNPSTNATNLRNTYSSKYWKRS